MPGVVLSLHVETGKARQPRLAAGGLPEGVDGTRGRRKWDGPLEGERGSEVCVAQYGRVTET